MKKFSTWLILAMAIVYWILRIIATYTSMMGIDFMIKPLDNNTEISLLFIALLSFILIAKRTWLGAIVYLVSYEGYFGYDIFQKFPSIVSGSLSVDEYMNVLFSFLGVILPFFVLFDLLLDKNRKAHPTDKKTDWFYKNKKFDRDLDERVDKNNYRTL